MQFDGSFTHADLISEAGVDEGKQWRGHLFGNAIYDLDNIWRAGTDVQLTSDKSYLQLYQISSADQLTNRAYLEGFKGRDYAVTNMYYFEDLRPGTQPVQPLVLPQMQAFSALGEPGQTWGGRWSVDGSTLVTSRDNSNQSLASKGPIHADFRLMPDGNGNSSSDTGLLTTISGLVRGNDQYWADNVTNPNGSGNNFNNVLLTRQFEQANAVARYPLGRNGDGYQQLIEPIVAITAAPRVNADIAPTD